MADISTEIDTVLKIVSNIVCVTGAVVLIGEYLALGRMGGPGVPSQWPACVLGLRLCPGDAPHRTRSGSISATHHHNSP